MKLPETKAVDLELSAEWLTIWFNEPERRNPLTGERVEDLIAVCKALYGRFDIRGVTIRGRGGYFCAGGDLKGFHAAFGAEDPEETLKRYSAEAAIVFDLIEELQQFVVMVVEGGAMAGGMGLACCGDLVIAQKDAKFALTEIRLGIIPAQITPFLLKRLGQATCRKLMLLADAISAHEAVTIGMVDFVGDDRSAVDQIEKQIRNSVLRNAPQALSTTKSLIRDIAELSRQDQVDRAAADFAQALVSEEGQQGVTAFLKKQKPNWVRGQE